MRRFSICVAFILLSAQQAFADPHLINGPSFVNNVIFYLIKNNSLSEQFNSSHEFGKNVCTTGGADGQLISRCERVRSIGEGICLAGGADGQLISRCERVRSIGEGICLAGGADGQLISRCERVRSIGEGLDLANRSGIDLRWAWDIFRDEYGNVVRRCRGTNTRQFADNNKCSVEPVEDRRWPGLIIHY